MGFTIWVRSSNRSLYWTQHGLPNKDKTGMTAEYEEIGAMWF
ncbi:hypothetical protein [Paenibacillus sp. FSL H8-0034]